MREIELNQERIKSNILKQFDDVKLSFTYKKLVDFHSINKYLFMAFHQDILKEMGRLIANHEHLSNDKIMTLYEDKLNHLLIQKITAVKLENTFNHMYGYFKNSISKTKKELYFALIKDYSQQIEGIDKIMNFLYDLVVQHNEEYLKKQTIFFILK